MWTSVYMTKNKEGAEALHRLLRDSGIISCMKKGEEFYELFVPAAEVDLAQDIILDTEINKKATNTFGGRIDYGERN